MTALRVAIIGATGVVGEELLRILEERRFPVGELRLFASSRSVGARVNALGRESSVQLIDLDHPPDFSTIDVAFFAAGAAVSLALAKGATAAGSLVIDKSTAFRLQPDVPL